MWTSLSRRLTDIVTTGWRRAAAGGAGHARAAGDAAGAASDRDNAIRLARSIVDALPDAALVLDGAAHVVAANAAAQDLFGAVVAGAHVRRTSRLPELSEAVATALETGQKTMFALAVNAPAERHLDGSAARLGWPGDRRGAPAVLVVLQDISEREALARMRMEFVANSSHELRTPLAALTGFIETLRTGAKDDAPARERFLAIMNDQAQRMARLVDDLLLLSRVEMRAHIAPTATADLNHVALECLRLSASAAAAEGVRLTSELADGAMLLQGDHDELLQAAQNLVANAIKYGRSHGDVVVRTARMAEPRGGNVLHLSVTDDGPGIAAEHLPRLTERFYRVNASASREKGGTGLGLAIVKHIAMRHRGRVEVRSELGKGSTFTLTFPALATNRGG